MEDAANSGFTLPDPYSVLLGPGTCWVPLPFDFKQWKLSAGKSPAGIGSYQQEIRELEEREGAITSTLSPPNLGSSATASSPYSYSAR